MCSASRKAETNASKYLSPSLERNIDFPVLKLLSHGCVVRTQLAYIRIWRCRQSQLWVIGSALRSLAFMKEASMLRLGFIPQQQTERLIQTGRTIYGSLQQLKFSWHFKNNSQSHCRPSELGHSESTPPTLRLVRKQIDMLRREEQHRLRMETSRA